MLMIKEQNTIPLEKLSFIYQLEFWRKYSFMLCLEPETTKEKKTKTKGQRALFGI